METRAHIIPLNNKHDKLSIWMEMCSLIAIFSDDIFQETIRPVYTARSYMRIDYEIWPVAATFNPDRAESKECHNH